jgi:predicted ATPase/class 3 adenylate cyclase
MPSARVVTFLFTDIEGSTRLWEQEPERMKPALARHDALARAVVEGNHGIVVKMSGDGLHAAFDDPLDALNATLDLQRSLADPESTHGISLRVRCGLHAGVNERRDNDFFGPAVNRAARIMSAAHGGQILMSEAVAALLRDRLPGNMTLNDLGSVRLRDLESAERIYQVAHPALRREFPALRSLEATPNNLPLQLTSFIGRERELAEVRGLLAKTRLLTLVGVGGIGKSRLSLQVAADAMDDYPDGVWLVELAHLTDGERVAQAVASVLAVKEEAGRPVIEALQKHVKDRQLLIVMDNCEHVIDACAELVRQLLQTAPKLKMLATSREHLRTAGEQIYAVPPLSLPEAQSVVTGGALAQFEATRLFIERATASLPAFDTTNADAAAIAAICRQLDGVPLAIELAAVRVQTLSVDAIAARLSDRFRLLAGGDRALLPRQQTLRALIDWSYDLLSEPERTVFRRLAVFTGGWTLDAAEIVVPGNEVREGDVLQLLTQLVEKSLVVSDATRQRYRLLDTVGEYARQRLDESNEGAAVRDLHLSHYLAFAEKAEPELIGPQRELWLARLDREQDNILSANARCDRAQRGAESGLKFAYSMRRYWIIRGSLGLAHDVTIDALHRPGAEARNLDRCKALFVAGQLGSWMGRYTEAHGYLEESLAIGREIEDRTWIARVLQPLGFACLGEGDVEAARHYFEEALVLAEALGNKRELAAALNALAQLHRAEGTTETAESLYQSVLALARELKDRESIAIALLNLAMVSIDRGRLDPARAMLLEVSSIVEEIGSRPIGQSMLEVSAGLAVLSESWGPAARMYWAAEAQAAQTGLHRDPADEAFLAPLIARVREALGDAAFEAASVAGSEISYEDAILSARAWLEQERGRSK